MYYSLYVLVNLYTYINSHICKPDKLLLLFIIWCGNPSKISDRVFCANKNLASLYKILAVRRLQHCLVWFAKQWGLDGTLMESSYHFLRYWFLFWKFKDVDLLILKDWHCWNSVQDWIMTQMAPFQIGIPMMTTHVYGSVFIALMVKCNIWISMDFPL